MDDMQASDCILNLNLKGDKWVKRRRINSWILKNIPPFIIIIIIISSSKTNPDKKLTGSQEDIQIFDAYAYQAILTP
jgi:hypothetical protein